MGQDQELPWSPPGRETSLVNQFSQLLFFVEERHRKVSRWGDDPQLKQNFSRLLETQPLFTVTDWLIYFVAQVTEANPTDIQAQKFALRHLACFYQLEFYFLARKWWLNCRSPRCVFAWEELFDAIAEPFIDLKQAQTTLKTFDPKIARKSYINTVCYRRGKDWLQKKFGADFFQTLPRLTSFDTALQEDGEQDKVQQNKLTRKLADSKASFDAQTIIKKEQNQVLQVVTATLEKLERDRTTEPAIVKDPSLLTIWEVMVIAYGTNIGQSGTAKILQGNDYFIEQTKLSRKLKGFKSRLFLQCSAAFAQEIAEQHHCKLLTNKADPSAIVPEQNENLQKMAQDQHKTLDPILKNYYQDWLFKVAIYPHSSQIFSAQLRVWLIDMLQVWFKQQLEIDFDLSYITTAMVKKMWQVLEAWEMELNQKDG